ncbi:MAG: hypothetical protein WCK65_08130 [Rhodospirillaceae bacterium]
MAGTVRTNSPLAAKGDAVPAIGYDRHDPHFPFGRPVAINIPRQTATAASAEAVPTYDKVVLPEAAAWVIDGLLAAIVSREHQIGILEAKLGVPPCDVPSTDPDTEPKSQVSSLSDSNVAKAQPVPESLLPLILSIINRRGPVNELRAATNLVVGQGPGGESALHVEIKFAINIPESTFRRIGTDNEYSTKQILQSLVVEEFRSGRLTFGEFRRLLDFKTRPIAIEFLLAHDVLLGELADSF